MVVRVVPGATALAQGAKESEAIVKDNNDGTYTATYSVECRGDYEVALLHLTLQHTYTGLACCLHTSKSRLTLCKTLYQGTGIRQLSPSFSEESCVCQDFFRHSSGLSGLMRQVHLAYEQEATQHYCIPITLHGSLETCLISAALGSLRGLIARCLVLGLGKHHDPLSKGCFRAIPLVPCS